MYNKNGVKSVIKNLKSTNKERNPLKIKEKMLLPL
jgi:hypothetical protein